MEKESERVKSERGEPSEAPPLWDESRGEPRFRAERVADESLWHVCQGQQGSTALGMLSGLLLMLLATDSSLEEHLHPGTHCCIDRFHCCEKFQKVLSNGKQLENNYVFIEQKLKK